MNIQCPYCLTTVSKEELNSNSLIQRRVIGPNAFKDNYWWCQTCGQGPKREELNNGEFYQDPEIQKREKLVMSKTRFGRLIY